ncbi:MAG: hypothetical protein IKD78_07445 [Bacteroidales bacterium]|nr:hypothetical protein [Bacteroidales bacterium]MBR6930226.1 hypothetical protein [Bacteroidales bacterium]
MDYIPKGRTKDDIKAREKLIKDFYSQWISEHPEKKIWNNNLGAFIHVKFLSINETYEKAARNYESTLAVFRLTEILENAVIIGEKATNRMTRNQKQFDKLIILKHGEVKLTVGLQRSTQEMVQYCITVPQKPDTKNKATTEM